jgi:hypothetical protein
MGRPLMRLGKAWVTAGGSAHPVPMKTGLVVGYGRPNIGLYQSRSWRGEGWFTMALGMYLAHDGFTADKYESALKQLEAAGAGSPKGRTLHVALQSDDAISVFDIWESQEEFDAFGATLIPILTGLGVELGEPMVAQVHNVIRG